MSHSLNTIIGLGLAGSVMCLTGCSSQPSVTKVGWEADGVPRHSGTYETGGKYQFAHYPSSKVYFEPFSRTYFWMEEGVWMEGPQLPSYFTVHAKDAKIVELSTRVPPINGLSSEAYASLINEQAETGSSPISQTRSFRPWGSTPPLPSTTPEPSIAQVQQVDSVDQ